MKVRNFKFFTPILAAALITTTATYSIDKNWCRNALLVEEVSITKNSTEEEAKAKTKKLIKR